MSVARTSPLARSAYSNPYQFISVIGGSTIYYCSAISAMTPDLPFDPTSTEGLADHERDPWLVAGALLGIESRRPGLGSAPTIPRPRPRPAGMRSPRG